MLTSARVSLILHTCTVRAAPTTSTPPAFGAATDAEYQGFVSYAHANQAVAWQLLTEIDAASKVPAPPGSCYPNLGLVG